MEPHDIDTTEQAVLAVLTGSPLTDVAVWARTSPVFLAEALERYRRAGRSALTPGRDPSDWHQVDIEFAHYPTAERAFLTYLLPALEQATELGTIGAWWFERRYPCWRLRVAPGRGATAEHLPEDLVVALHSAVSWGVVKRWWSAPYEPETTAFGGPEGLEIAHALFQADSVGALDCLHRTRAAGSGLPDAPTTSLLLIGQFLRAAGQEWSEQGDVWARVETARPLPEYVPAEQVDATAGTLCELLAADADMAAGGTDGLAPYARWADGLRRGGEALAHAGNTGRLSAGTRGILARHIVVHWNRMGFSRDQQALWARAAKQTILTA